MEGSISPGFSRDEYREEKPRQAVRIRLVCAYLSYLCDRAFAPLKQLYRQTREEGYTQSVWQEWELTQLPRKGA